jgi:hypothetical protein
VLLMALVFLCAAFPARAIDGFAFVIQNFDGTPGRTAVFLVWDTPNVSSTSQIAYGVTPALGSQTAVDTTMVTSHTMVVSGLPSSTTYYFQAISTDAVGRVAYSQLIVVTTLAAPQATPTPGPPPPVNYDETVVDWGDNYYGETNVPAGLTGVTAVAAGGYHTVALKGDGTVVAWGSNSNGQTTVPAGLSGVTAVAAGGYHTVALKSDGTVVAWGLNSSGQTNVPAGLSGVTAVAAGGYHTVALKGDGTVVAWGYNNDGETTVPAGLSGVTAIAAGGYHTVALKGDGTVVAWGSNGNGQTTGPAGLSGATAIAAGRFHTVAVKGDGTVVAWGWNGQGETTVPAGLSGVTAIAAGDYHTVALKGDGTVVAWGSNSNGQTTVPAGLSGVTAIAAGGNNTVALRRTYPLNVTVAGSGRVQSTPSGIDCGATCNTTFVAGSPVTLSPTPSSGWAFTGWSGACSGTGACSLSMNDVKSVGATFLAAVGTGCLTGIGCASGFCVDGFCCDRACTGQCEACDVPGSPGVCTGVAGAPHSSRPPCASDGSSCGGSCDGSNTASCSYPSAVIQCGGPSCANGLATLASFCNATGSCGAPATQACAPYTCGTTACNTSCATNADCVAGLVCAGTVCTPPLQITSVTPASGSAGGGTTVTMVGSDLEAGATVSVGGSPASNVIVSSPTSLQFTTPAGTTGWADVVVTLPDGRQAVANGAFLYVNGPAITEVSPATGSTAGGTAVTISGTGFAAGAVVNIGGVTAGTATVINQSILLSTPPGPAGPADVVVTNPDGQSATLVGGFSYDASATQTGSNVAVQPVVTGAPDGSTTPATITFDDVISGGETTVQVISNLSTVPIGYRVGSPPAQYDITSTATFNGSVQICLHYAASSFSYAATAKLFHFESGAWKDITTSRDMDNQIICGKTTSFSPFILAEPIVYSLTVTQVGSGGLVTSSDTIGGLNCTSASCSALATYGTNVTLTAQSIDPSQYVFMSWSGCSSGSGNVCVVPVYGDRQAVATFEPARFPLTLTFGGTATGSVTGVAWDSCTSTGCTAMVANGATVTLTAQPGSNLFQGWGITCTGTGSCSFKMNSAKTVQATFNPAMYPLSVTVAGAGSGGVTSSSGGISCGNGGTACSTSFANGGSVTLTASFDSTKYIFTGWAGGACSGTATACTVTMNAATSVTATFDPITYPVTVSVSGAGSGSVSSTTAVGANLSCTIGSTANCTANFAKSSTVVLTANPDGNSVFGVWSGCSSVSGNKCTIYATSAKTVTATFQPAYYPLTVGLSGTGTGTLSGTAGGSTITWANCTSSACTASVANGASVSLTASANAGSTFKGWGVVCSGTGACSFKMNAAKNPSATFSSP